MSQRIVIIGASGSGKSFLANQLAAVSGIPVIHLDFLYWECGKTREKRPERSVHEEIVKIKKKPAWIVEGVHAELTAPLLEHAQLLIWLDLPWEVCKAGLLKRHPAEATNSAAPLMEEERERFFHWASQYWSRMSLHSHRDHQRRFGDFRGKKLRITDRNDVADFLKKYKRSGSRLLFIVRAQIKRKFKRLTPRSRNPESLS